MDWQSTLSGAHLHGEPPAPRDVTHDSREIRPGWAFVAVPGARADGHDYLGEALERGATALVVQGDRESLWKAYEGLAPLVVVEDTRRALAPLAAAVHGRPAHDLRIVGVTGTDGKTTSSHLIAHVLDACGFAGGYLTSAGFDTGHGFELNASHMTTLEATSIQRLLAAARDAGRKSMVVEASSEGLAQHRLDCCEFDVAVFTNLTRDHLDFHGTMEAYLQAKGILFEMLDETAEKPFPRAAVLNADDPASEYLRSRTHVAALTYALAAEADIRATEVIADEKGYSFVLAADGATSSARSPLLGRFNIYNCLAAVAVAVSQGARLEDAVDALGSFAGVPGRLEAIDCGQPFRVYVDIASTPAALENTLKALRPVTTRRMWVVFGAAGGRDPARRDGMGRVAGRLAERIVLTNEDPRDEDPDAIIEAIAVGLRDAGRRENTDFVRRPDRREAIAYAFENATAGDTVLLAGKATETTMIVGSRHVPWDERAVARELLGCR